MGTSILTWNFIIFGVVMYCVILMPYFLVFFPNWEAKEYFEESLNIFFFCDIFVNFLTPYYDVDHLLIVDGNRIAMHY